MRCDCTHGSHERSGQVRVAVHFEPDEVRLTGTPFGVLIDLRGTMPGGAVGGPAFPKTTVKVAVPAAQWPTGLRVEHEVFVPLTDGPTFVAPAQPPRAGMYGTGRPHDLMTGAEQPHGRIKASTCRTDAERGREDFPEPFDPPPVVPPDPALYEEAIRSPRPLAVAVRIEQTGLQRIAVIELNPVRLNAHGQVEICVSCEIALNYSSEPPLADRALSHRALEARLGREIDPDRLVPLPEPAITSRAHAQRLTAIARSEVLNPELVADFSNNWRELYLLADYLIITDDLTWNAQRIAPGESRPGLVAAFRRLARWKTSRGVRTRVVTISSIVNGEYGDYRTGSRDLQEVIRRFLKTMAPRWGVSWVLLGGDVDVVPIRKVAGASEGHIAMGADNPPADNTAFWTGAFLKMHVVSAGTWWEASTMNVLVRPDTGQVIPYDPIGMSSATAPGWFFTTSDSYATRSLTPTDFVRVNGPAAVVNAPLQFLYQWNTIPTDFYYASLSSYVIAYLNVSTPLGGSFMLPYVWFPQHDWDALDNGIYGQHTDDGDMDGVVLATDVSVGRAPVSSDVQANAFVDKVMAYEQYSGPFIDADSNWPRRVVLASSNWDGRTEIAPTPKAIPGDKEYHHVAGTQFSLIKLAVPQMPFASALIARISNADLRIIPYSENAGPGVRGWYFARSATDLQVSEVLLPIAGMLIRFPIPSPWIVVFGPAAELTPLRFLVDSTDPDRSMVDQEALREQLVNELPIFDTFTRLYEDHFDLTPAQAGAAPVQNLSAERLENALNAGPHIVSLSGHGTSGGCCLGGVSMARRLKNGPRGFIVYADSCLTNQVDAEDAFSEALVYNPDGGAVAYVGNTRFSWIGVGDNFQRAFFHRLTGTRHLGLLNDSRVGLLGSTGFRVRAERWAIFALNLTGDPEMQIHKRRGRRIGITIDGRFGAHLVEVKVIEVNLPRPRPDPPPVASALVYLRQGERELIATTNERGEARFDLRGFDLGPVEITLSHDEFVPSQVLMTITGPEWVEGVVTEVSHRDDGDRTAVTLESGDRMHRFIAYGDRPDYRLILDAVENAYISKTAIALFVDSIEDGGGIERFRFRDGRRS